jgi:hypothetical protein
MSSPNYNPRTSRRRDKKSSSIVGSSSTVKTLVTTAVVAYGAYKAYEYLAPREDENEGEDGVDTVMGKLPGWLSSLWLEEEQDSTRSGVPQQQQQQQQRTSSQKKQPKPHPDPRTRHRLAQQSIRKCRQDIRNAYSTCWPALQQVIDEQTNTISLTQELRSLRQQQKRPPSQERQDELWQRIQSETFTKFVATTYASSLLILSLTLQLHWISGQVFQEQQQPQPQQQVGSTTTARRAQEVMMQSHDYFKTQGLPLLIAAIRRAIAGTPMGEWKPTTFVTLPELQHALGRVDAHLERGSGGSSGSSSYSRNWIRIIFPDPTVCWNEDEDEDEDSTTSDDHDDHDENTEEEVNPLSSMLEAFWDLAESPAWQDAQLQTLQTTQRYLRDKGWGKEFYHHRQQVADMDKECKDGSSMEGDPSSSKPTQQQQHVPLAKLMAPFKTSCGLVGVASSSTPVGGVDNSTNTTTKRKKKSPSSSSLMLVSQLQKLPTVLELGEVSFQEFVFSATPR